jgi:hypothetical protein
MAGYACKVEGAENISRAAFHGTHTLANANRILPSDTLCCCIPANAPRHPQVPNGISIGKSIVAVKVDSGTSGR